MMGKIIRHVIFCWLFVAVSVSALAAKEDIPVPRIDRLQDEIVHAFRNSLGYIRSEQDDSIAMYGDSLVAVLDKEGDYNTYFELERIIIRSHVLRQETRIALAHSDLMYSKAKALNHAYGLALSLNAMGEVYSYTNRWEDSNGVLKESLGILEDSSENKALTKIILLKLLDNSLHLKEFKEAKAYLEQLYKYPAVSVAEKGLLLNYNAYYCIQTGAVDEAGEYLEQARKLLPELPQGIVQHLWVTTASYYEAKGEYDKAMDAYSRFFETKRPERNRGLYIDVMRNKAGLLVKMEKKEEAYDEYNKIYAYVNKVFKANYPKEIDQLTARFQADQLAYQNERSRNLSIRYYATGITVCVLAMCCFIFLSWKKIFRLKESKKKQEEMKRKAENAIRKKNLFLSNMSHEVRTPLNAIVGFSSVLTSEEDMGMDEESRKEACEIIRVNSQQLLKLINDILDLSDFEEENIQFNIKEYDAVKVCKDVIETIKASYKLDVDLYLETNLSSLLLDTDDSRLRQVLINLLVNAVKFTKQGAIVLRLETTNEGIALFSVTDTGCGIPLEKQKKIFERFEKLNEFVQGTGLGLSICLLIVKYVGGKIWIDGNYTRGARFCFTHPLKFKSTLLHPV